MTYKIQTNIPKEHLDIIRIAMWNAGAGVIGNYTHCAFVTSGLWYFLPMDGAKPAIGQVWVTEQVEEYRLEMVCEEDKLKQVVQALKDKHPYEEPPIEITKLEQFP